ncbi:AraC family transcriptional regulator N-terminal domain-containing protein [Terrihabitans rhizophilus]
MGYIGGMPDALLSTVETHANAHAGADGMAQTPLTGVTIIRSEAPSGLAHAVSKPLICLVLQGRKHVTVGREELDFGAGDSLVITGDMPMVSQITQARADAPYLSIVFELDTALITDLCLEIGNAAGPGGPPVQIGPTDREVSDAALRLMRLVERPASIPVLREQLMRELHYWLLMGRHGPAVRRLGWPDGHEQRVARAVAVIRAEFSRPIPVGRLAAVAGMSLSSFHHHFRAVTSLSPLQFQKTLRLIEARRLMIAEGRSASAAAFAVGYESAPQFTREYGRMFGSSPARDAEAARGVLEAAE